MVRSVLAGELEQVVELLAESHDVTEQSHAALEGQGGQGHAPAVVDLAHHEVGVGAGPVEEDLVELRGPGQLPDGPDLDAGLVHGDEEVGEPPMARRLGVGAAEDEAPVGPLGVRGPDLLARDHPLVVLEDRLGLDVGEVGAGVGLGVALAPQLGPPADGIEEPRSSARRCRRR